MEQIWSNSYKISFRKIIGWCDKMQQNICRSRLSNVNIYLTKVYKICHWFLIFAFKLLLSKNQISFWSVLLHKMQRCESNYQHNYPYTCIEIANKMEVDHNNGNKELNHHSPNPGGANRTYGFYGNVLYFSSCRRAWRR